MWITSSVPAKSAPKSLTLPKKRNLPAIRPNGKRMISSWKIIRPTRLCLLSSSAWLFSANRGRISSRSWNLLILQLRFPLRQYALCLILNCFWNTWKKLRSAFCRMLSVPPKKYRWYRFFTQSSIPTKRKKSVIFSPKCLSPSSPPPYRTTFRNGTAAFSSILMKMPISFRTARSFLFKILRKL